MLRFLHEPVPAPTDNAAERLLRTHKRVLHQKVTFCSAELIDDWRFRDRSYDTVYVEENLFGAITEIMVRSLPDLVVSAEPNLAENTDTSSKRLLHREGGVGGSDRRQAWEY